jgi:DNA-binding PucR family transcriptional regulator
MLAAGSSALWAWVAPDAELVDLASASASLPAAVRVAAGRPTRGPAGFRASHHDAQLARRQMPLAGHPGPIVPFRDVVLACLMAGDPEAMRRMVSDELGGLARRDPATTRLRDTVRVYLECGGNGREAADRLSMHKKTVAYRLARVEELPGRPVAERRLELEVALMLAHVLGDRVLPDDQTAGRS